MAKVTMKDVARAAETSPATVSKVLNGRAEEEAISEACRRRVMAACRELGYVRQHAARSLRTGRSYALGGLLAMSGGCRDDGSLERMQFHAPLLAGMLGAANEQGLELIAVAEREGRGPLENGLHLLETGRIEGLIVPGLYARRPEVVRAMEESGRPIVLALWECESRLPQVLVDDVSAIPEVLDHFHELGHRRIAWMGPAAEEDIYCGRRERVYRDWMKDRGLLEAVLNPHPPTGPLTGAFGERVRSLVDPVHGLIQHKPRPTALLCYNEAWAVAAYHAAQRLGLSVPEDLSVVGFDNIYGATALPPLSVVSLDLDRVGKRAVQILADVAAGKVRYDDLTGTIEQVPTSYVRRSSVAPAPESPGETK
jgi:DNA-binding LacI/PurR family transcriptional regulator